MDGFKCKRCGHVAGQKCDLVNHLRRKRPCQPILDDTDCETLLQQVQAECHRNKTSQRREKRAQVRAGESEEMRGVLEEISKLRKELVGVKGILKEFQSLIQV